MRNDSPLNRWHVSRTINLGHLLTTAVILITVMWFFSQQDSRLSQAELSIRYIQDGRTADQLRTSKQLDDIRSYVLRIEGKLDRIIER